MHTIRIIKYLPLILLSLIFSQGASALDFASGSKLRAGKWIKVSIGESGIYEISYKTLHEMGFSAPEKVGVFGKGGRQLPFSFTDGKNQLYRDDLTAVGVYHHDNKIFFYGESVENINFDPSSSKFEREGKNIYSDKGVYFLSDCENPRLISMEESPGGVTKSYSLGFDYLYHENDLFQNTTLTGQIFWGESLLNKGADLKWHFNLPFLDNNAKARLECKVFAADKSNGTLKYGVQEATAGNRTYAVRHPSPASGTKENPEFMHMSNPVALLSIPTTNINVYANVVNGKGNFINLDYWILSYSKHIPDLSLTSSPQERFTVALSGTRTGTISADGNEHTVVFDVTNPQEVSILNNTSGNGINQYFFKSVGDYRNFIFADLSRQQLSISGYEEVKNTDLHSQAAQGADFIIIATPKFMDFARKLADLHNSHNGMNVMVACSEDVYNEFSGGNPDPMAYRALMKMTYDADPQKLKNMLLVGKFIGNFRSVAKKDDSEEYLIGFQDNKVSLSTDASNVMDYYGMTDDYTYTSLQNNKLGVGIGLLPLYSADEADTYLKKVEYYLNDTDKASYLNEMMAMGGTGDAHTHDTQAVQLAECWNRYTPQPTIATELAFDAYGEKKSKETIHAEYRIGKIISTYTGHGNQVGLDSSDNIFKSTHINGLKNKNQGFILIYGCDMSDTDFARKGFGEQIVTDSQYGAVGSMMATRTVWSGQNFELAKLFTSSLFSDFSDNVKEGNETRYLYRKNSPTIGEVYAQTKSNSNYINSLAYMYIGDPALTVPLPLRHISVTAPEKSASSTPFKISGKILSRDSIHLNDSKTIESYNLPIDTAYNGKVVIKIMDEESKMTSRDFITHCGVELILKSPDTRIAEFQTTVKNGIFETDLILPAEVDRIQGANFRIYVSAYDYERDLGASGYSTVTLNPASSTSADTTPPSISILQTSGSDLIISATDDCGIRSRNISAYIDDAPLNLIASEGLERTAETGHQLYAFLDNYKSGTHTLKVVAEDMAGNKTIKEEKIEINPSAPNITLTSDRKVADGEIYFSYNSEEEFSSPILSLCSQDGTIIYSKTMEGKEVRWDCKTSSGVPSISGLHKAKIEAMSKDGRPLSSEWVHFVVR